MVPVVVCRLDARSLIPVYDTRQIVPPMSSAISSDPSFITAKAAGRPHTSARCWPEIQNPVRKLFVAAVGPAILEPDPHNLIAGGLRTIRRHCFHLNPTSGTKIRHRINIICASSHQRLHLGVEPSFEVNNAGGGYLIISWLLVSSKGELSIFCLGIKQIYLLGPRLLLTSSQC